MTATYWLIVGGVVAALWLLRPRRRPPRRGSTTGPRYWFEFRSPDGEARIAYCATERDARRAAAEAYGGRYVGRYDTDFGGRM